ncbi:hypothetical protein MM300_04390 [Evansella sp. LMS18]|uniref:hypothetical protein n=1 Tax=Evansella sp. LMS18 TaxID=2924033 RepID=UPI0020D051B6|nr:hypothetical protein [Evansella sp. LMS18]UTR11575.1 hypothetical protein MM300_04390 [Evansella sp. LMS18]
MYSKTLEIRGINEGEIISYLTDIGASPVAEDNTLFQGKNWTGRIDEVSFIRMFQSDIPQISLLFESTEEQTLNKVIEKFRRKTFRAGG